jgi:hypothetical protein
MVKKTIGKNTLANPPVAASPIIPSAFFMNPIIISFYIDFALS